MGQEGALRLEVSGRKNGTGLNAETGNMDHGDHPSQDLRDSHQPSRRGIDDEYVPKS